MNLPDRLLCIISIISFFLSNRKGFIDINGHYTELFDINVGLPQGSVLSPLRFIFYLSDFLSEVEVKFKFADDSSAIISAFNTDAFNTFTFSSTNYLSKYRVLVQKVENDS